MLGQLLWHRLVHDGGVDEWGIAHGSARMVYASCLAGTTDCTVDEVEACLVDMESLGMIVRYEVDNALYLATRNHEMYQNWRECRSCPELPMSQDVADMRDWSRLNRRTDRRDSILKRVTQWAERYSIILTVDGETIGNGPRQHHAPCTGTVPVQSGASTGTVGVGVGVREEQCTNRHRRRAREVDTADEPDVPETDGGGVDMFETELPEPAARLLASVDVTPADAVRLLNTDDELEGLQPSDLIIIAVAQAVSCQTARNPPGAWRARIRRGAEPTNEHLNEARRALGIAQRPSWYRDPPTREFQCEECGARHTEQTRDDRFICPQCNGVMMTLEELARIEDARIRREMRDDLANDET